jgi:hypothetical protein
MQLQQRATPCKRLANSCRGTRISRGIYNPGNTFVAMYAVLGGKHGLFLFPNTKNNYSPRLCRSWKRVRYAIHRGETKRIPEKTSDGHGNVNGITIARLRVNV